MSVRQPPGAKRPDANRGDSTGAERAAGERGRTGTPDRVAGGHYRQVTRGVAVTVRPEYLPRESSPAEGRYVWAYHIRIENQGDRTVQLLSRHWRITDARGKTNEVRGPGVVGQQPVLAPGQHFEYASGTPLPTPHGIMVGSYRMEGTEGELFDVAVPAFSLDSPHEAKRLN